MRSCAFFRTDTLGELQFARQHQFHLAAYDGTPGLVDYVIIHELVHTKIKNHSRDFYDAVEKILPDYKKRIRWLKQNGKFLAL